MKKFVSALKKYKKALVTSAIVSVMAFSTAITSFAVDPTPDDASTITTGITSLFNQVATNWSFTNLVTFLGIALGTCSVIALGYFGLRKVLAMIQTALKKGKIKV